MLKIPENVLAPLARLNEQIDDLAPIRNRVMHGRPLEFEDFPRLVDAIRSLLTFSSDAFTNIRFWHDKVKVDPLSVLGIPINAAISRESAHVLNNLPVPDFDDTGFLGRGSEVKVTLPLKNVSQG